MSFLLSVRLKEKCCTEKFLFYTSKRISRVHRYIPIVILVLCEDFSYKFDIIAQIFHFSYRQPKNNPNWERLLETFEIQPSSAEM